MRSTSLWALFPIFLSASFFTAFAGAVPGVHGLWVWKSPSVLGPPQGAEALRDFCKSKGINEVYISVPANNEVSEDNQLAHLITLLHRSNIRVEALFSSVDADEPGKHRDKLLDRVREVVHFNQKHSANRFDGLHLDVEPQQRPENKGRGNLQFLPDLVDTFHAVVAIADPAGLTVNVDVQNKVLKGDLNQRRMLLSAIPRVTLMMYELTGPHDGASAEQKADQVQKASQNYLDIAFKGLGDSNLARMAIALRTADYGDLLPLMLKKLDDANQANPHYLGWARHSYNDVRQSTQ